MTPPPTESLRFREAVRALVLDDDDQVLLVRYEFPTATVWGLPGGGLLPDEDDLAGLRRELREELGLREVAIGPHVWSREHVIPMLTGHDGQRDRIYLVRLPRFEPVPEIGWDAMRSEFVHETRWWSLDAISEATNSKSTLFAPRRLARLARQLLDDGPPVHPVDTGI
jgi:8-oxo-dGTP pyrophosphatase MutT (NUDIX family)